MTVDKLKAIRETCKGELLLCMNNTEEALKDLLGEAS